MTIIGITGPRISVSGWSAVALLLQAGRADGQAEAEPPMVGAFAGEQAVERGHEHPRDQLPYDQTSVASCRPGNVLVRGGSARVAVASVAERLQSSRATPRSGALMSPVAGVPSASP